MTDASNDEIETRFRNAGVVVPGALKAGAFAAAAEALAQTHWLRRPRTAAAEPSNIFSLVPKETTDAAD